MGGANNSLSDFSLDDLRTRADELGVLQNLDSYMAIDNLFDHVFTKFDNEGFFDKNFVFNLDFNLSYVRLKDFRKLDFAFKNNAKKGSPSFSDLESLVLSHRPGEVEMVPEEFIKTENYISVSTLIDDTLKKSGNIIFRDIENSISKLSRYSIENFESEKLDKKIKSISEDLSRTVNVAKYMKSLYSARDLNIDAALIYDSISKFDNPDYVFSLVKDNKTTYLLDSVVRSHATFNGLNPSSTVHASNFNGNSGNDIQYAIEIAKTINQAKDVLFAYDVTDGKSNFIYVNSEGKFFSLPSNIKSAGLKGNDKISAVSTLVQTWSDVIVQGLIQKIIDSPFKSLDSKLRFFGIEDNLATSVAKNLSNDTLIRGVTGIDSKFIPASAETALNVVFDEALILNQSKEYSNVFAESVKKIYSEYINKVLPDVSYKTFSETESQFANYIRKMVFVSDSDNNVDDTVVSLSLPKEDVDGVMSDLSDIFSDSKYEIMQGGNSGVCTVFDIANLYQVIAPNQSSIEVLDTSESVREIDPFSSTVMLSQVYFHETTHLAQINTPLIWKNVLVSVMGFLADKAASDAESGKLDSVIGEITERSVSGGREPYDNVKKSYLRTLDQYAAICIGTGVNAEKMRSKGFYNHLTDINLEYGRAVYSKSGEMISLVKPHIDLYDLEINAMRAQERADEIKSRRALFDDDESFQKYMTQQVLDAAKQGPNPKYAELRSRLIKAKRNGDVDAIKQINQEREILKQENMNVSSKYVSTLRKFKAAVDSQNNKRIETVADELRNLGFNIEKGIKFFNYDGSYYADIYSNIPLDQSKNSQQTRFYLDELKNAISKGSVSRLRELKDKFTLWGEEISTIIETQAESFSVDLVSRLIHDYKPDSEFTTETRNYYCTQLERQVISSGERALLYKEFESKAKSKEELNELLASHGMKYERVLTSKQAAVVSDNLLKLEYSPINPFEAYDDIDGLKQRINEYNEKNEDTILFEDCLKPINSARAKIDLRYRSQIPNFLNMIRKLGPERSFNIITNVESLDDLKKYF